VGWANDFDTRLGLLVVLSFPLSVVGWIYWLFCIHRLHLILCRASGGRYPVSARRAVGLQLIPFYSWVWRFRWSNQIADFAKQHSPEPMKVNRPGLLLVLGSLLGTLALLAAQVSSLRLFVLFTVTLYLSRRIRKVVTFTDALQVERRRQLDMALSAGLGAGLGFLLFRALVEFYGKGWKEQLQDGLGILLLSYALARFIEPLLEKVRVAAGMETAHASHPEHRPWMVRTAVLLALIFSNFFHDLLHTQIDRHFDQSWQPLALGLVVSGGITYFWISGIRQEPRRAARFGVLSGAGIALLAAYVLGLALGSGKEATAAKEALVKLPEVVQADAGKIKSAGTLADHIPAVPFGTIKNAGTMAWPWALMGLVGGLVIDRNCVGRGVRSVAISILGVALLGAVAWLLWTHSGSWKDATMQLAGDIGAVGGWCLGLLLHPANVAIFGTR
jgi:hypothetical protein